MQECDTITTRIERRKHGESMFETVSLSTRATWDTPCSGHYSAELTLKTVSYLEGAWALKGNDETRVTYTVDNCDYILSLD